MPAQEQENLVDQVVLALQAMTTAQTVHRLSAWVGRDVTFSDPRLFTRGAHELTEAYKSLFDGIDGMIMRVTDRAWGQDNHTVYLRWDRLLKLPGGKTKSYTGMTEIMISPDGKIAAIVDHWDGADHDVPKPRSLLGRIFKR